MALPRSERHGQLTSEHWALVDEIAVDLQTYVEMILRLERERTFPDAFTDWLAVWCVLLGELAWESYTAISILLKTKNVRAAFGLSRNLYDYYVRLAYYRAQAGPTITAWRADPRKMKHMLNGLKKVHAYCDWFTINKKMASHIQMTSPDLSDLSERELSRFEKAMTASNDGGSGIRRFHDMMEVVWSEDKEARQLAYAQWLHRSAYLHGDPLTRVEVLREHVVNRNSEYDVLFDETGISPVHVMAGATYYVLALMTEFYSVTDRHYAVMALVPKMRKLFPITTPRNKAERQL